MAGTPIYPFDNDRLKTVKVIAALRDSSQLPEKRVDRPNALECRQAFVEKIAKATGTPPIKPRADRPFASALNSALGLVRGGGGAGGGGGGGGSYTAQAVNFDGLTTLYTNALTGGAASSVGTFFHWFRSDVQVPTLSTLANFTDTGLQENGLYPITNGNNPANFYLDGTLNGSQAKRYIYQCASNDGASDLGIYADVDAMDGSWQLTACSWNTNAVAGSRTFQIWQNGALRTVTIWYEDGIAFDIDWSVPVFCIGSDGWQGSAGHYTIAEPFIGDFSDMFLDITTAVDLSDPAVIAKIISGGKPVDQGATGNLLTGSQPLLYMAGNAATYGVNKGYGGSFSVAGALTNATTSPSD